MELYKKEDIVNFLKKEFADEINAETFMENLTPIELPSDEEICVQFENYSENWEIRHALQVGAKWMRDKIQGGNNEQQ